MATIDNYKKVIDDNNSSQASAIEQSKDAQTNANNSYYDNLKNESYRTMLNAEIQASNAKEQALKYTGEAMKASGLSGQGVSESSRIGINNAYQNALANANAQHNANVNQYAIAQQQANAQAENDYTNNMMALNDKYASQMANAIQMQQDQARQDEAVRQFNEQMAYQQNKDVLDRYANALNGATNDKQLNDLKDTIKKDEALTEEQKDSLIKGTYESLMDTYNKAQASEEASAISQDLTTNGKTSVELLETLDKVNNGNYSATDKSILNNQIQESLSQYKIDLNTKGFDSLTLSNGKSAKNHLDQALRQMKKFVDNNEITNGSVIKMQGDFNKDYYAYVVYNNGNWYATDESAYNNANLRHVITTDGSGNTTMVNKSTTSGRYK